MENGMNYDPQIEATRKANTLAFWNALDKGCIAFAEAHKLMTALDDEETYSDYFVARINHLTQSFGDGTTEEEARTYYGHIDWAELSKATDDKRDNDKREEAVGLFSDKDALREYLSQIDPLTGKRYRDLNRTEFLAMGAFFKARVSQHEAELELMLAARESYRNAA